MLCVLTLKMVAFIFLMVINFMLVLFSLSLFFYNLQSCVSFVADKLQRVNQLNVEIARLGNKYVSSTTNLYS